MTVPLKSTPRNWSSSGYAEALSLATAANAAVRDAFNQRSGLEGEVHELNEHVKC